MSRSKEHICRVCKAQLGPPKTSLSITQTFWAIIFQTEDMIKFTKCPPRGKGKAPERAVTLESTRSLAALKADADLWYRIHVLIYDLRKMRKDKASEARTLLTTDELYISAPYFTATEAARIKATIVDIEDYITYADLANIEFLHAAPSTMTIEEALKSRLARLFEKRRASCDARPCGPHEMAPIYEMVFGILPVETLDEKFLSRLRRSGLGDGA